MPPTLSDIRLYPIKSTAGQALSRARVEARGLAGDRRWMLVDENGRFLTGREHAGLTRLRAEPLADGLAIRHQDGRSLRVPFPGGPDRQVHIWRDSLEARDAGDRAATWFEALLGRPCRLVYMDEEHRRPVDPDHSRPGDQVSFADGFPLLLLSRASVADLNERLEHPVTAWHFRPNLVIEGCAAFEEDRWRRIRIGEVDFELVKPCARCVFTSVDPDRGERRPDGEPLRTLGGYRRDGRGRILFGQNLVARSTGWVRQGDSVTVLEPSENA